MYRHPCKLLKLHQMHWMHNCKTTDWKAIVSRVRHISFLSSPVGPGICLHLDARSGRAWREKIRSGMTGKDQVRHDVKRSGQAWREEKLTGTKEGRAQQMPSQQVKSACFLKFRGRNRTELTIWRLLKVKTEWILPFSQYSLLREHIQEKLSFGNGP